MIDKGFCSYQANNCSYIAIDLSDKKHKNRVLHFIETKNILTEEDEYVIKAQWTSDQYHPSMTMSKSELIDFVNALNEWL